MSQILGVPYCTIFTEADSQHADSYITVNYSNTFHNTKQTVREQNYAS